MSEPALPFLATRRFSGHLKLCGGCVAATLLSTQLLPAAETPPPIQWQASFGGSAQDSCHSVLATYDGGFLLGGESSSGISGNKSAVSYGGIDFWIVKVDANGNKLWDRSFGGSSTDLLLSMAATADGGSLLLGYTSSGVSGNKTSVDYGDFDFWLVKVDADGHKVWDKSFGGSSQDLPRTVEPTSDGGFLLGGVSTSGPSGNKTSANFGDFDVWLVKVDADGNKVWDKSFGGTGREFTFTDASIVIIPSGDGGFLMGATSGSGVSGNKTDPNYGEVDYWLVKLDADGNKLWDKSFGGSLDDVIRGVAPAPDGGFLLAGISGSGISGNKTSLALGLNDAWLVKVDATGNKVWDKSLGGSGDDQVRSVTSIGDEGFIMAGFRLPDADYWLARMDAHGNTVWERSYGGNSSDYLSAFAAGNDGGFLLGGDSYSGISGDKTSPQYGGGDFWVIKLESDCTNCPPSFTLQPTNQSVLPGTNVSLSARAVGGAVQYQWSFEGAKIPGATSATYSFTSASLENHGIYRVEARNEFGSTLSAGAFVSVLVRPGFATPLQPQSVLQGQSATFTAVVTGAPPIYYRWFRGSTPVLTSSVPFLVLTNCQSNTTIRVAATNFASGAGGVISAPATLTVLADFDSDGMADAWETLHGFDTNSAADALLDADADGMINRHEYVGGTHPRDSASVLKLTLSREGALEFHAQSNVAYSIQHRTNLTLGPWFNFTNVSAQPQSRAVSVNVFESSSRAEGFYRVVTPPPQ